MVAASAIAEPAQDSTAGLRRALASGVAIVYLHHGTYAISEAIDVPPAVLRIVGMKTEGICTIVENRQGAHTDISATIPPPRFPRCVM
jgi:hypothetical protein